MSYRTDALRLFFAVFPGEAVRRAIHELQLQQRFSARPVAPRNMHITLVFLGQVASARVDKLEQLAGSVHCPAVSMTLDRLGCFTRSGVVWVAPSEVPAGLERFRRALSEAISDAGFRVDERRWRPHVTLYRKLRKPCATMSIEPIEWPVSDFCLVASRLEKSGPFYQVLKGWPATGERRLPG